jgi:ATP-dependent helicase HrpB
MAQAFGEKVGETVGFRVRLENRVSRRTRIEVVTEGVFTRQILADPSLEGVAGVLFDEFHERSLEGDLALALARDAQQGLREDLRLLVMSATLDASRIADLLGGAPVIESAGRMYPVTTEYLPPSHGTEPAVAAAAAVRQALRRETGSVLVFLPGAREIERCARELVPALADYPIDVRTLYGALDPAAQDAAIAPAQPGRRKVVIASAIAETSLTIEGVRIVVDAGLSRQPRFEPDVGVTRLETVRASQASAEQRKGRAGRLEPGLCIRLWAQGETRARPAFDPPEILNADLSSLALDLAAWGVRDPNSLAFLDPPAPASWTQALTHLQALGALTLEGTLTGHGKALADMPLPPRLAHMVLTCPPEARKSAALLAVAMTEEGLGGRDTDARSRIDRLRRDGSPRAKAATNLAGRIADRAGARSTAIDQGSIGTALARAFPDRVAKARGQGTFQLANGRQAKLDPADPLSQEAFLAVGEIVGAADRALIKLAAPLALSEIEALFPHAITDTQDVRYDPATATVRARRTRRYLRLTLTDAPLPNPAPSQVQAAMAKAIQAGGLDLFGPLPELRRLQARVALLRKLDGEARWPDITDANLLNEADTWLTPLLEGQSRLDAVAPHIENAVENLMDYAQRKTLSEFAPIHYTSPAGGVHPIDYLHDNGPAVSLRLQELFGLNRHPAVANNRAPLLLLLVSPAGRPVQTTRDLPGFWKGSYSAVRADLRGRYSKHPWPEDPLAEPPTRRVKPKPSS